MRSFNSYRYVLISAEMWFPNAKWFSNIRILSKEFILRYGDDLLYYEYLYVMDFFYLTPRSGFLMLLRDYLGEFGDFAAINFNISPDYAKRYKYGDFNCDSFTKTRKEESLRPSMDGKQVHNGTYLFLSFPTSKNTYL